MRYTCFAKDQKFAYRVGNFWENSFSIGFFDLQLSGSPGLQLSSSSALQVSRSSNLQQISRSPDL